MVWILSILKSIGGGIASAAHWFWFTATLRTKLIIIALAAGLCVLGYILYLQHANAELRQDVIDGNLNRQLVNVDILTNQINESKEKSNALAQNTDQADANRNAVDRRDSNSFSGGDNDAAFCRRNPDDSSCRAYCAEHPDVCRR